MVPRLLEENPVRFPNQHRIRLNSNPPRSAQLSVGSLPFTITRMILYGLALLALLLASHTDAQDARRFECGSVFNSQMTVASLSAVFGEANVVMTEVHAGEGDYVTGTVIFEDTRDRVEIIWKDQIVPGAPFEVRIREELSTWATPEGLKVGLDLRAVEAINGRPFTLLGFGWDYGGTVMSWESGHLQKTSGEECRLIARMTPDHSNDDPEFWRAYRAVRGEGSSSSDLPAMQLLNPKIYELMLVFR